MGYNLKGIISPTRAPLDAINTRINNKMKANDSTYRADRWGEVIKHPTLNKWLLIINDDSRNPLTALTNNEKTQRIDFDNSEWRPLDSPNL